MPDLNWNSERVSILQTNSPIAVLEFPSQFNTEGLSALFNHPCPFDGVIEVSGSNKAMQMSLDSLKTGGLAIWLGATFPQDDVCISAEKLVRKLLSIRGLHNYNIQDFIYAVRIY